MALLWLQDLDLIPEPEHLGSGPAKGHVIRRGNRPVLTAVLLALSIVGIGTTASYLQGPWQAVFLAVFVLVLPAVVGLVLVRIGRPRGG